MAQNLSVDRTAPRGWPPRKTLTLVAVPYGPFIPCASRPSPAARISLASELLGQKPLDFRPVLPQQPFQVQHARPRLPFIPRRVEPPAVPLRRVEAELQQPQQQHRQQQHLGRPHDRVLRPRPAFFPAQSLLEIAEAVLLAEATAEHLQQLQPAQVAGAADQREPLAVAFDFGHHRLDLHLRPGHGPQAFHLLVADVPPAAVEPGLALVPAARPAAAATGWGQPPPPLRPGAAPTRRHFGRWQGGPGQQGAEDNPVVGADRGGAVGAAGGVLVEGAGAPDRLAGAMHLGVVAGPDVVAVPPPARGLRDEAGGGALQGVLVPGAVL